MKRIFTLLLMGSIGLSASAQRLLTEDFNYTAGQLTDASGGANVSGSLWLSNTGTGFLIQVTAGSLTYPNYYTAPLAGSNKLTLQAPTGSAEDAFRNFAPVATATNSTVYATFLLNIKDQVGLDAATTGTGDYFMGFLPSTSTSTYAARLYARKGVAPNTFVLGISATSATSTPTVYTTTEYAVNTPHIVTMAYQFVPGPTNDIAKLFVDQPYSVTEPVPNAASTLNPGTELADIGRIAVRQGFVTSGVNSTPNADIDAIKVSTSYADATLPLSLTAFHAALNGKAVNVSWSTANEVNVKGFSVEKSLNGSTYSEIAFVQAKNSTSVNNYSITDENVKAGAGYYRLKMIDRDGSEKYSQVAMVNNKNAVKASMFPNPAINNVTINHTKAEGSATIKIVTLEGRQLKVVSIQAGAQQTALSVSDLARGNYLMIYENNGGQSISKFSKQ